MRKHMKTEDVIVCSELNEYIWNRGARHPPSKVSVTALKIQINGEMRTIVNLTSAGIDKQAQLYKAQVAADKTKPTLEAEVKETPIKEEVKTEKKADDKKEAKKTKEDVKNG